MNWIKSSRCESHTCIEVAPALAGQIAIGDSKITNYRAAPATWLKVSRPAWAAFTAAVEDDRFGRARHEQIIAALKAAGFGHGLWALPPVERDA